MDPPKNGGPASFDAERRRWRSGWRGSCYRFVTTCGGRTDMTRDTGRLAHRLDFLETELSRMGDAASDAERDLRKNPTDQEARDRLSAIYDLARSVWHSIQELRRDLQASPG